MLQLFFGSDLKHQGSGGKRKFEKYIDVGFRQGLCSFPQSFFHVSYIFFSYLSSSILGADKINNSR